MEQQIIEPPEHYFPCEGCGKQIVEAELDEETEESLCEHCYRTRIEERERDALK